MKNIKRIVFSAMLSITTTQYSTYFKKLLQPAQNALNNITKKPVFQNIFKHWNKEIQNNELKSDPWKFEGRDWEYYSNEKMQEAKATFHDKVTKPAEKVGSQITDNLNKLQENPKFQKVLNPVAKTLGQAKNQLHNPKIFTDIKDQVISGRSSLLRNLRWSGQEQTAAILTPEEAYTAAIELEQREAAQKIQQYKKEIHYRVHENINTWLTRLLFSPESNNRIQQIITNYQTLGDTQTIQNAKEAVTAMRILDNLLYLCTSGYITSSLFSAGLKAAPRSSHQIGNKKSGEGVAIKIIGDHLKESFVQLIQQNEPLIINKLEYILRTLPQNHQFLEYANSLTTQTNVLNLNLLHTWRQAQITAGHSIANFINNSSQYHLEHHNKISLLAEKRITQLLRLYEEQLLNFLHSDKNSISDSFYETTKRSDRVV